MDADNKRRVDAKKTVDLMTQIEADLTIVGGPLAHILMRSRQAQRSALAGLAIIKPDDMVGIMKLQSDIEMFDTLCQWVHEARARGDEAYDAMDSEDREALKDIYFAEGARTDD